MKMIIAALAVLCSGAVAADCRVINGRNADDTGYPMVHLPYSSANTDYEAKIVVGAGQIGNNPVPLVTVPDGNGGMADFLYSLKYRTSEANLPPELQVGGPGFLYVTAASTGEVCTVYSDGDEYTTDDWIIQHFRQGNDIISVVQASDLQKQ